MASRMIVKSDRRREHESLPVSNEANDTGIMIQSV
ncbi:hypothetical protein SAMN06265222_103222 [Neorhodopirellula lusitana]|uniref:Uncharacterized protein n=1 Tax=Neorhodopirellula lusitana TaxID=445327 RepID=A0ABY1PW96_9BACT|nr:hypothetical protein SAMN06265222_103222 [Neorhodopirellula lusitana]